MTEAKKRTKRTASYDGFTDEERAAMKERGRELKTTARRGTPASPEEAEAEVLAKIAEMPPPDRALAERLHKIVRANAPSLTPRLWYGMPAYAKAGKVVCFFQTAEKFKTRYATVGFSDQANLDDGTLWPTSYALTDLTPATAKAIGALVKKAAS